MRIFDIMMMIRKEHIFDVEPDSQQKQPSEVFFVKRCSQKFHKIRMKTFVPESLFNKVAGLRPATLLKKRLSHSCFLVNTSRRLLLSHLITTFALQYIQPWQHRQHGSVLCWKKTNCNFWSWTKLLELTISQLTRLGYLTSHEYSISFITRPFIEPGKIV